MIEVWLVTFGLIFLALGIWIILLYNRLVSLDNAAARAWANIDVILRQRSDELRNLVVVVKGYASHEKGLFEHVATARAAVSGGASLPEKAQASAELSNDFVRLVAIAEAYPDLKANENFLALQKRISGLEDLLADRREYYNQSVVLFNTRIREIPDTWLAQRMRLTPKEYFQADATDGVVPAL
jgi:LemA protein